MDYVRVSLHKNTILKNTLLSLLFALVCATTIHFIDWEKYVNAKKSIGFVKSYELQRAPERTKTGKE